MSADAPALFLERGGVLSADGHLEVRDLSIADGRIVETAPAGAERIDVHGLTVLPGIVDIHGDAFERELMPRPNVMFPVEVALASVDAQLIASGVTTAYHGVTLTWEPGLRDLDNARAFLAALADERQRLMSDHRVQLRWETFAFEAIGIVEEFALRAPRPAIAINDHTAATVAKVEAGTHRKLSQWAERSGLSVEEYVARLRQVWERRDEVPAAIKRVADIAHAAGAVLLSHDERTCEERSANRALGARVVEFPLAREVAANAILAGEPTVLGAPNVVRGGSHTGALDATEAVLAGLCTILTSDYYYPSLLAALGRLVSEHGMTVEAAWPLVSTNPARALQLSDRGTLAIGNRADVVVVDWRNPRSPVVVLTVAGGKVCRVRPWPK